MSYGRTVNRPEFRELAPFLFYDYKLEAGRIGNPNLETAVIDNIDMRYEFYPRFGETVSIGGFFKYFDSPIENRTIITTEQPNFTYINADYAINYGLELEVRKSLKGLAPNTFVEKLGINANASYIFSEVDLGASAVAQQRTRPLQGQSPYIINAGLFYSNEERKLDATLNYNVFGPRIFSVGDVLFPTIFELQRHSLDLTISKEFKGGIALKVGVQDLLNYPFQFFQDTDRTETATDLDDPIFTFRRGSIVTFSFRIKI
jgi:outer membrane receptor protein involved in Fe transport